MRKIEAEVLAHAGDLLEFIDQSPSPWHAVAAIRQRLDDHGFQELDESQAWSLSPGDRRYVVRDGSSLIAFVAGLKDLADTGFKLVGAHTDSPGFRVKPNALARSGNLDRINVEIYGSPIIATFTDRDLSLAGRVTFSSGSPGLESRLLKVDQPMLRLPNLAIHMNRKVNEEGLRLKLQDQLPLLFSYNSGSGVAENPFTDFIGERLGIDANSIRAWDLAVFDTQKGVIYGPNDEFLANSQLDNLASCHASMTALLQPAAKNEPATRVCAFFDHEEIGSQSMKGAEGSFLPDVLERITLAMGADHEAYKRALARSFLISADMAHAYQPNFDSAYEPDHPVFVNQGPVIKINANQRYASESVSESRFVQLCSEAGVPWQKYCHRSDLPCGTTIGPITSARLGIRSVDVGCPMWSMHSIRESAGVLDHGHMTRVMTHFFNRGL